MTKSSLRVLVADDDRVSRAGLAASLERQGHQVVTAVNGREAWERFRHETFPVLISDWLMPELTGVDLCRKVRAENRPQYTYIIVLTQLEGKGHYLEGMEAGADDFVPKPFDPDLLAARLRAAERILRLQREVKQLRGLLPVCSYCRKIRDEQSRWVALEEYVAQRTEAHFSHGLCKECFQTRVKPELEALGLKADSKVW